LLLGLAITAPPLVLLFGALLVQSASVQCVQMESRVSQVSDALVSDIDREFDRDITILHTLATSEALSDEDWPAFYEQAKAGLQGRAYLVLVDAKGRQLVNTYVPYGKQPAVTGDPETLRRILETRKPAVSNGQRTRNARSRSRWLRPSRQFDRCLGSRFLPSLRLRLGCHLSC
jgi:hypothetical protein